MADEPRLVTIHHPATGGVAQVPESTAAVLVETAGWRYGEPDAIRDEGEEG